MEVSCFSKTCVSSRYFNNWHFLGSSDGKTGDLGSIPALVRSLGEGNGYPC